MARALPTCLTFDSLCCLLFSESPAAGTIRQVSTYGKTRRKIEQLHLVPSKFRTPPRLVDPLADSEKPAEMALRESVRSVDYLLPGFEHINGLNNG